ncbi:WecB/TagA/CpsF family glycosyltransferase [Niallia sp. Man26]|uniref:WecB/TagA/CpsF family glycosyltransferase n=1 Tax=Niallia sp. Man26 TaxID=2912824 RepID=UPI001ED9F2A7|nr:WecB/TagA/CpsF family glycosyltransferase [Niallia sp. Man26]UPO87340.1 WecB/TagA/CpsF family glycosyltransferase [Niallia sp. Man26]
MHKEKVNLFGVDFDNLDMKRALEEIDNIIKINKTRRKHSFVVTPNIDHLVNIDKSQSFKKIYEQASLKLVDGMPIVLLSKVLKKPLIEKISGADLTPELIEMANNKGYRVFIFGSNEGVADTVVNIYKQRFGNEFQIECYSPPFGFENNEYELNKSIEKINGFSPDILLVSLGSPKGEYFIYNNINLVNVPISLQVGASIDFIAGTVKRAPVWMQKSSLEWFYRFIQEPKRMFKRYFINDVAFIKIVLKELVGK